MGSASQSSRRILVLDLLRTVAAFCVLAGHWRALFFVNWNDVDDKSAISSVFYGITGLGHEAVIVFFVLSGYVITSSIRTNNLKGGAFFWREYLLSRCTRLCVVVAPALLITAAVDWMGIAIFGAQGIYAGEHVFGALLQRPVMPNLTLINFLGNLAFLQTILFPIFGSNDPLWSLSNEFWYYIIFPLFYVAIVVPGSYKKKGLYFALACSLLIFVGDSIRIYFLVWLLGASVALVSSGDRGWGKTGPFIGMVLFFSMLAVSRLNQGNGGVIPDFMVAVGFAALLWLLRASIFWGADGAFMRSAGWASDRSFSLYAYHFPLLVFLRASMGGGGRAQPTAHHIADLSTLLIVVTATAFLLAELTERRTSVVRRWISSRFFRMRET